MSLSWCVLQHLENDINVDAGINKYGAFPSDLVDHSRHLEATEWISQTRQLAEELPFKSEPFILDPRADNVTHVKELYPF